MPGYFLDTSALAKLYHSEPGSQRMEFLAADRGARLFVSGLALVEMESVFAIKVRTGAIDQVTFRQLIKAFFSDLADRRFRAIVLGRRDYANAERLIRSHGLSHALRTLDALQLAVALRLFQDGAISTLIASDKTLCEVAGLEGVPVMNPLD